MGVTLSWTRPQACVLTGPPRSHVIVGDMIAEAIGARRCRRLDDCRDCGRIIFMDNLNFYTAPLVRRLGPERVVLYLVAEGPSNVKLDAAAASVLSKVRAVASPSRFSAQFVEEALRPAGRGVDAIVPHGISLPGGQVEVGGREGMLYRAYYMKRKYPGYGIAAVAEFLRRHPGYPIDIYATGAPMDVIYLQQVLPNVRQVPDMPREELERLYLSHRFWLNLSDCEGFGMMPLEAMARGEVVIAPRIPAFEETVPPDTNFLVPVDGTWDEYWWYLNIRHYKYDPEDMVEAMERAVETPEAVLDSYAEENVKWAAQFDYRKVYIRFLELL